MSPAQRSALRAAFAWGRLQFHAGGQWRPPGVTGWHASTVTVRALEKKGLLERAHVRPESWADDRVLTVAGIAAVG